MVSNCYLKSNIKYTSLKKRSHLIESIVEHYALGGMIK